MINPNTQKLTDFDLVHLFSAINGNHRIAEYAKAFGLPVVTSPLIQPHWTRGMGRWARLLESLVGKTTNWNIKTEYRMIESCLRNSDCVIALGETERQCIIEAFGISGDLVRVIPNGIPERFFNASPNLAIEMLKASEPFILNVAAINPYKNQLTLTRAIASTGMKLVLVGDCLPFQQSYLEKILAYEHVTYIGKLDYDAPLLASLYAAASVFCLPSLSEVMPLSALEALAAGTPVVLTENHCMNLEGFGAMVKEVPPNNEQAIRDAISALLRQGSDGKVRSALAKTYTWEAVGESIYKCYKDVLARV